jgi:hypothetical protein
MGTRNETSGVCINGGVNEVGAKPKSCHLSDLPARTKNEAAVMSPACLTLMGDSLLNTQMPEFLINDLKKGTHNICICSRRVIYLRKALSVRCKSIILKTTYFGRSGALF